MLCEDEWIRPSVKLEERKRKGKPFTVALQGSPNQSNEDIEEI